MDKKHKKRIFAIVNIAALKHYHHMLKNTTAAIYPPLMPEGLFIIHKKLFPLRTGQHLSRKGGEKNQKNGNLSATLAPANKKIQKKNDNLFPPAAACHPAACPDCFGSGGF
ncbi:MAG: hypothetical protein H3C54_10550 [Taibaiella sp.]|nr:hypothetical protein [Taibaiella sp.]